MPKKFKTNVTYAMIFKKMLSRGEKNLRLIITAKLGNSYSVYIAFLEAIKSSVIASDNMIECLEMQIYTNESNIITSIKLENIFTSKIEEGLKPLLNNAVALKFNVYRKGAKLTWLIINGAAYKRREISKAKVDYNDYAEVLERFLQCHESQNIKCTIVDDVKLSNEEKIKKIEELITAGILNQKTIYSNVRITYTNGIYRKEILSKNHGKLTGEELREKIHEVFTNKDVCFVYVSIITTRKKLLEWAICY